MTEASTQVDDGLLAAKASASSAAYQHQRCTQTERGNTRGVTSAHILVADYQPQDRSSLLPARAGFLSIDALLPVNWPGLRVRSLYARSAGSSRARDLSAIGTGSRPAVGNTSAHHQSVNAFGDVPHVQVLSKASLRSTHIGRSEKEWRYLISVMRCPK